MRAPREVESSCDSHQRDPDAYWSTTRRQGERDRAGRSRHRSPRPGGTSASQDTRSQMVGRGEGPARHGGARRRRADGDGALHRQRTGAHARRLRPRAGRRGDGRAREHRSLACSVGSPVVRAEASAMPSVAPCPTSYTSTPASRARSVPSPRDPCASCTHRTASRSSGEISPRCKHFAYRSAERVLAAGDGLRRRGQSSRSDLGEDGRRSQRGDGVEFRGPCSIRRHSIRPPHDRS